MKTKSIAVVAAVAVGATALLLIWRSPSTTTDAAEAPWHDSDSPGARAPRAVEVTTSPDDAHEEAQRDRAPAVSSSPAAAVMVLNLVDPNGAPVPDVRVTVDLFRASDPDDEPAPRVANFVAISDANGCARVELGPDLARRSRAWIAAARMPELACRAGLVLDPPLAAKSHAIDLLPTGSILVHVKDRAGNAVAGISVEAKARCAVPIVALAHARADANGELRFNHVPAGTYVIQALGPRAIPGLHAAVHAGNDVCVDAELMIENSARELAVSGIVVDEHGAPLADASVGCRTLPGGELEMLHVSKDGTFEFVSTRSETVEASVVPGPFDIDDFEPVRIEVPFGSTNVSFRRVRVLPELSAKVCLIDADDQHLLIDGSATICPRIRHGSMGDSLGFPLHVRCKLRPDWVYILRAPGYKSRIGSLEELQRLAETQEVNQSFRTSADRVVFLRSVALALDKGFDEEFAVRDAQNAEPIAGVIAMTSDGGSALTDAQGFVTLRAAKWPKSITFEHEGFMPVTLDPNRRDHATGELLMKRLLR
jgi:hypothetical protein